MFMYSGMYKVFNLSKKKNCTSRVLRKKTGMAEWESYSSAESGLLKNKHPQSHLILLSSEEVHKQEDKL